jgi:hypothetical protein
MGRLRKEGKVRTLLPDDQQLLSDQQLRDASDEQLQDLIARVDLLLRSKGQTGLTLHPPEDGVTPQNLPIPQTRVPSAPSSSLSAHRRPAKPLKLGFAGPSTTRKPWCSSNRVPLCQATLSIGLYLLLEGPVPTRIFYPGRRRINV